MKVSHALGDGDVICRVCEPDGNGTLEKHHSRLTWKPQQSPLRTSNLSANLELPEAIDYRVSPFCGRSREFDVVFGTDQRQDLGEILGNTQGLRTYGNDCH